MSDTSLVLEDVRSAFVMHYREFYTPTEASQMFDGWANQFTEEIRNKGYDQGFKNGVKCAERIAAREKRHAR